MSVTSDMWRDAMADAEQRRLADVFDRDANTANTLAEVAQTVRRALYRTASGEKQMRALRLADELHAALLALNEEYVGRSAEHRRKEMGE